MFAGFMPHLLNYFDIATDFFYALKSFFLFKAISFLLSKAISNGTLKTGPEQKNLALLKSQVIINSTASSSCLL